jgi:cytochrome c-type biogenesis protein CcmH/NrfF
MRGRLVAVLLAAAAIMPALPARAAPEDVATSIAREIMSPFCPGVTLHDCPSAQADALRVEIAHWARNGWSRDRIMAQLVSEYGEDVRALPPAKGSGLFAWLLPLCALIVGGVIAWLLPRRWTARRLSPDKRSPSSAPTSQDRRRLDAELDALRGRT